MDDHKQDSSYAANSVLVNGWKHIRAIAEKGQPLLSLLLTRAGFSGNQSGPAADVVHAKQKAVDNWAVDSLCLWLPLACQCLDHVFD